MQHRIDHFITTKDFHGDDDSIDAFTCNLSRIPSPNTSGSMALMEKNQQQRKFPNPHLTSNLQPYQPSIPNPEPYLSSILNLQTSILVQSILLTYNTCLTIPSSPTFPSTVNFRFKTTQNLLLPYPPYLLTTRNTSYNGTTIKEENWLTLTRNRSNRFPLAPEGDVSGQRKSVSQATVNSDDPQIAAGKTLHCRPHRKQQ